ncbi:hypothetical protein J6590_079485 [Homalodisca vitripennis]|nr:hypothetical protein J6590_079485 [Homalodisca vitripennis]
MLDKKRNKGVVKLGSQSSTMVVTHKQVQELLERGTSAQLPNTEATLADLKSLCLALLEALQDKTLALAHQKKANKILASRISDLEQRFSSNAPIQLLQQSLASTDVMSLPLRLTDRMITDQNSNDSELRDSFSTDVGSEYHPSSESETDGEENVRYLPDNFIESIAEYTDIEIGLAENAEMEVNIIENENNRYDLAQQDHNVEMVVNAIHEQLIGLWTNTNNVPQTFDFIGQEQINIQADDPAEVFGSIFDDSILDKIPSSHGPIKEQMSIGETLYQSMQHSING